MKLFPQGDQLKINVINVKFSEFGNGSYVVLAFGGRFSHRGRDSIYRCPAYLLSPSPIFSQSIPTSLRPHWIGGLVCGQLAQCSRTFLASEL